MMIKATLAGLIIGGAIVACSESNSSKSTPVVSSAEQQCMDKHRWDTTAVNTSRLAVQMHYHRKGQGELASGPVSILEYNR